MRVCVIKCYLRGPNLLQGGELASVIKDSLVKGSAEGGRTSDRKNGRSLHSQSGGMSFPRKSTAGTSLERSKEDGDITSASPQKYIDAGGKSLGALSMRPYQRSVGAVSNTVVGDSPPPRSKAVAATSDSTKPTAASATVPSLLESTFSGETPDQNDITPQLVPLSQTVVSKLSHRVSLRPNGVGQRVLARTTQWLCKSVCVT